MMQNSPNFIMNFIIYMNVFGFINFGKYFVKFFWKTFEGGSDHFELVVCRGVEQVDCAQKKVQNSIFDGTVFHGANIFQIFPTTFITKNILGSF